MQAGIPPPVKNWPAPVEMTIFLQGLSMVAECGGAGKSVSKASFGIPIALIGFFIFKSVVKLALYCTLFSADNPERPQI